MNKTRRQELDNAAALIDQAREIIQSAAADEREYYDSMPEGLQESERGNRANEAADALEEAADALEEATERLTSARD